MSEKIPKNSGEEQIHSQLQIPAQRRNQNQRVIVDINRKFSCYRDRNCMESFLLHEDWDCNWTNGKRSRKTLNKIMPKP